MSTDALDHEHFIRAAIQEARSAQEAGNLLFGAVLVAPDVIESYYDVVRQQQQLAVLREAVSISRERLRIVELRRDLGSASDLEVRQAR